MKKAAVFLLALALGGCTAPYIPVPIQISDADQYQSDVEACQQAAANYRPRPSRGGVAYAALAGAAGNISYAPINPAIPVLGAVGAAASSAGAAYDITGQARRNVAKHCLHDMVRRDQSAIVANPDD